MTELARGKQDMSNNGWIGVDLDGTIAHYDEWRGPLHIGEPIPAMVHRVRCWLQENKDVRIFTARVFNDGGRLDVTQIIAAIELWCAMHIGCVLPITNQKDYGMIELWDDRAVQVEANTGRRMDGA